MGVSKASYAVTDTNFIPLVWHRVFADLACRGFALLVRRSRPNPAEHADKLTDSGAQARFVKQARPTRLL